MNRRKKRCLLIRVMQLEILVIVALTAFLMGRKTGTAAGRKEMLEAVRATGVNQIYWAGKDTELPEYVGEKVQDKEREEGTKETEKADKADKEKEEFRKRSPASDQESLKLLYKEHPELILVNKEHALPKEYEVELKKLSDGTNRAHVLAYDALTSMLQAGRREGLFFEVCSSYRSPERQQELLDEDIEVLMRKGYSYKEAYGEVTKETMPAGHSEHATGLAFDIVALDYQLLDKHQKETAENKWLREHCAEYGFILRYPKEKEEVTGISYESWHFRYVGKEAAGHIMNEGITLEEYLEEYLSGELDIY